MIRKLIQLKTWWPGKQVIFLSLKLLLRSFQPVFWGKPGRRVFSGNRLSLGQKWIPAFAGMTTFTSKNFISIKKKGAYLFIVALIILSNSLTAEPIFQTTFDGQGEQQFTFEVEEWGRYSIQAFNPEGTALQIVDRKTGPGEADGIPGGSNGRLDLLLEKGEYKIITRSHSKGQHTTTVKVFSFTELNQSNPQYLNKHKLYQKELRDLEQVSYWIKVDKITTLQLEVLGRNLADLQLWKEGSWRQEVRLESFKSLSTSGTPLYGLRMIAHVSSGMYRVTAYAGEEREWSANSKKHPLYLIRDMPSTASTGALAAEISPIGHNHYVVPGEVSRVLVETPEKVSLHLQVGPYTEENPYQRIIAEDSIHVKANAPRCMVNVRRNRASFYRIKVSGTPGQSFKLQTLTPYKSTIDVDKAGNYWLSTIHTGDPADQIGASGVLLKQGRDRDYQIIAGQLDTLSSDRPIVRRFNLLDNMDLYLWVAEAGEYTIAPDGVEVEWRVERSYYDRPPNYQSPSSVRGEGSVDLQRGLHQLKLNPLRKGVLTLQIKHSSLFSKLKDFAAQITAGDDTTLATGLPRIQFPSIYLKDGRDERYVFLLNNQSPEMAGVILRPLPINLSEPLSIYISPQQEIRIPIQVPQKMQLSITDLKQKHYSFKLNGVRYQSPYVIDSGQYSLTIENPSSQHRFVYAHTYEPEMLPDAPPTPVSSDDLAKLPEFPTIEPGKEMFLDLNRGEQAVYRFDVTAPGIYRLETSGRLRTQLILRSRLQTSLATEAGNGLGRNALILDYLLPGKYQVTVRPLHRSAGHLGVSMKKSVLINGGHLTLDRDKRVRVPRNQAVTYRLEIPEAGRYWVESLGQEGYFKARLEDGDGWPILKPGLTAKIERNFKPGAYQLISLPENRENRRITRLQKLPEAAEFDGKGPHQLKLNQTITATWMEEKEEGHRKPARFRFTTPAPIPAKLFLSDEFEATLANLDHDTTLLTWSGSEAIDLPAGGHEIAVLAQHEQNYIDFRLSVNTDFLIAGLSQTIGEPQTLEVRVGRAGIVELFSRGTVDVAAKLYSADGKTLIAANDDASLDWNFRISRFLKAGTYQLQVNSQGKSSFSTTIGMNALEDTLFSDISPDRFLEANLRGKIATLPLLSPSNADIIYVNITGQSKLSGLIEQEEGAGDYRVLAEADGETLSFALPVADDNNYRLKVWSEAHSNTPISLTYEAAIAQEIDIEELLTGWSGTVPADRKSKSLWFRLRMDEQWLGHYRVLSAKKNNQVQTLQTSAQLNSPFASEEGHYFSSLDKQIWLRIGFETSGDVSFKLSPYRLTEQAPIRVPLMEHTPRAFEVARSPNTFSIITVETDFGRPLAGMYAEDEGFFYPKHNIPITFGQSMAPRRCLTADFPEDSHRLVVWNASSGPSAAPVDATIKQTSFKIDNARVLDYGIQPVELKGSGSSQRFQLPAEGWHLIKVKQESDAVAIWKDKDGRREVKSTERDIGVLEFTKKSGELYLANLGQAPQPCVVEVIKMIDKTALTANRTLRPERGIEEYKHLPGEMTLYLPQDMSREQHLKLHYQGAVESVQWYSVAGILHHEIESGSQLTVQEGEETPQRDRYPGGLLNIRHGVGGIKFNLAEPGQSEFRKWGHDISAESVTPLNEPTSLVMNNEITWLTLNIDTLKHIRLQSDDGLVGILMRDGDIVRYHADFVAFNWELPLRQGNYTIGLRKLTYQHNRPVRVTFRQGSILTISEGDSPTIHFASGESRIFHFTIDAEKKIGLGLKTEREVVEARLYDEDWRLISRGQQQYGDLQPGDYFLWLRVPADQPATVCTPVLVGQNPPATKPPEEVVKRIIDEAE